MLQTDVSNLTGTLPKLERLRGTLRLMFNPCPRYKVEKSILLSCLAKAVYSLARIGFDNCHRLRACLVRHVTLREIVPVGCRSELKEGMV